MLHDAFAPLGAIGLNCACVDQPVEITRQRVGQGDCFVAETAGRIVGTATFCGPDRSSPCPTYRGGRTAAVRQLAVQPELQGRGIGRRLLALAEAWAQARGHQRLALDTPLAAAYLVDYYKRRGFRAEECFCFPGRHYSSLVMVKDLPDVRLAQEPDADDWLEAA
ncbi:MAG: GNAT family N-acetyltransferase [Rhodocyclaceae bacterium]|nr:GNAT family N-acetyltransferase [Rhodocyclaceae bacterium]